MAPEHVSTEQRPASLEELIETVPDAMLGVRRDGTIVLANTAAETLFGYQRGELLGQPVEILVPEMARARHLAHRASYAQQPSTRPMGNGMELAAQHKGGRLIPVEISLSQVDTERGPLVAAAVRDVTERNRVEQALRQKNAELEQASSAKDRFLASMSHELRTPLNAILGFTGTLLMGLPGPLNEEQESQLQTVRGSAQELLAVLNNLLDLAKIESGTVKLVLAPVDCGAVLKEVAAAMTPLATAKGLALEVKPADQPVVALADRSTLRQVIGELVDNAVRLTDRGDVRLAASRRDDGLRGTVALDVTDTGPGLTAAEQANVFDAFEPVGQGHSGPRAGLGLHISRRRTELMGGTLTCRSAPGRGSIFTVELGEG